MHMLRLFKNQVLLVTVMLDRIFSRFFIFNKALVISRKGKYSGKYKIEYERVTIILCFRKYFVSFPSLNNYLKAQFIKGWTQRSIVTFMYLYSSEQDRILERLRYIFVTMASCLKGNLLSFKTRNNEHFATSTKLYQH